MELKTKDTYKIIKIDYRNDYQSLFLLYLPIIGYKPISLYMTLLSEFDNQILLEDHSRLSILLNMSLDEILESR